MDGLPKHPPSFLCFHWLGKDVCSYNYNFKLKLILYLSLFNLWMIFFNHPTMLLTLVGMMNGLPNHPPCFLRFHCLGKDGGASHLLPVGCRQEGPLGNFLFKLRYSSPPHIQLHLWKNFDRTKSQYHFFQSFRSQDFFWGTFCNFAEKTNGWFWYASNLLAWHWVRTSSA